MKTMNLLKTGISFMTFALLLSCSKDDANSNDNASTPTDSRNVKYEVSGTATGTFDVTYITGSSSGSNAVPSALPWTKEIVAPNGFFAPTINASVFGATPGKTLTAKIYVGGVVKKEQTEIVQSNGMAIIGGLQYSLK
ncbi:MmpS family transport accessory protein [Flavobacterium sp. NG2]|uniref:MmpS family transport accessory protein n=1 Tax=Flavobacterium sp. NG2 TaxID=3097547 RepID=UPI002A838952|nr:MmpS family transport accessory protein [Flavobacterium sp. NG2]WPR70358.1 MmpS family transport accessory protein [Flavobacterium sp. NG2]